MFETGHEMAELWVFGYGSLMWNPGFEFAEQRAATVYGFHRSFCIYSTHYRGTHHRPGLVLGLDYGGVCTGAAFRIAQNRRAEVLEYLRAREQISGVYRERFVKMHLGAAPGIPSREVTGVTYVVERYHPSYAGRLSALKQARIIRAAHGRAGPNLEYLVNTWKLLDARGIEDMRLHRVVSLAGGVVCRPSHGRACQFMQVVAARLVFDGSRRAANADRVAPPVRISLEHCASLT